MNYRGPDLAVNAKWRGNAMRFVNDEWGRNYEGQKNCEVEAHWKPAPDANA